MKQKTIFIILGIVKGIPVLILGGMFAFYAIEDIKENNDCIEEGGIGYEKTLRGCAFEVTVGNETRIVVPATNSSYTKP